MVNQRLPQSARLFKGPEGGLTAYITLRDQNAGQRHRDWWSGSLGQRQEGALEHAVADGAVGGVVVKALAIHALAGRQRTGRDLAVRRTMLRSAPARKLGLPEVSTTLRTAGSQCRNLLKSGLRRSLKARTPSFDSSVW